MDSKTIEQLLERYWRCDTTLEEEARLRAFFARGDVPQHLLRYKALFVYQDLLHGAHLGDDFDARMLALVEPEKPVVVEAKRISMRSRLMPLFKAAATVAVVLLLGGVAQRTFFADQGRTVVATDTVRQQAGNAPSAALTGEKYEQQLLDSLEQAQERQLVREKNE